MYILFLQRWFVSGTVQCFSNGHTALALLSIAVLVAALLLLPVCVILATGPWEKVRLNSTVKPPNNYTHQWGQGKCP